MLRLKIISCVCEGVWVSVKRKNISNSSYSILSAIQKQLFCNTALFTDLPQQNTGESNPQMHRALTADDLQIPSAEFKMLTVVILLHTALRKMECNLRKTKVKWLRSSMPATFNINISIRLVGLVYHIICCRLKGLNITLYVNSASTTARSG